jgi:ankyrin repeat protein
LSAALCLAVAQGRTEIAEDLLAAGADPNASVESKPPALVLAVQLGDLELTKLLLAHGGKVNEAGTPRTNALVVACRQRRLDLVRLLIDSGADVNVFTHTTYVQGSDPTKRHEYDTPYLTAVRAKEPEITKMLLVAGVNLQAKLGDVRHGDLAVHAAAIVRDFDTVDELLKLGFNINAKDHRGRTPLMAVVEDQYSSAIRPLLERGADVALRDPAGRTALDLAKSKAVAEILASAGAAHGGQVEQLSPAVAVPMLIRAVDSGDVDALRKLVRSGVQVNAKDDDGNVAIVVAAYRNRIEPVRVLLEAKADPNAQGQGEWTALMYAARAGNSEIVEALLRAGADVQVQNVADRTARDLAGDASAVVTLLDERGAAKLDARRLIDAVRRSDVGQVNRQIKEGANVNGVDARGRTPLFYALDGQDPPHFEGFRFKRNREVILALVEAGADVNHADRAGRTPLMALLSAEWDAAAGDIVRLLLYRGAKADATDAAGQTVATYARELKDATERAAILDVLSRPKPR